MCRWRFGEPGPSRTTRSDGQGPQSPLQQQDDYYVLREPCETGREPETGPLPASAQPARASGVANASGPRGDSTTDGDDGYASWDDELEDEAQLSERTVQQREQAGAHYDSYFNSCADWETPPLQPGYKLVACDQAVLSRYFAAGLEDPGPEGLSISNRVAGAGTPVTSVPAVFETGDRDEAARALISANAPATTTVYASERRANGGEQTAAFERVPVQPGNPLRLNRSGSSWSLIDRHGRIVAAAKASCGTRDPLHGPVGLRQRGGAGFSS